MKSTHTRRIFCRVSGLVIVYLRGRIAVGSLVFEVQSLAASGFCIWSTFDRFLPSVVAYHVRVFPTIIRT